MTEFEQETTSPAAEAGGDNLQRTNLMLPKSDSDWLDALAVEILAAGGAKISRSEIVRAAIAMLKELHKSRTGVFEDLALVKEAGHLEMMAVVAARMAITQVRTVRK